MAYKENYSLKDVLRSFVTPTNAEEIKATQNKQIINHMPSSATEEAHEVCTTPKKFDVPPKTSSSINNSAATSLLNEKLGTRLIESGFLTQSQRFTAVARQRDLFAQGIDTPLGEVIVDCGFCTQEVVERLMNEDLKSPTVEILGIHNPENIGDRMISAGLITHQQRDMLVEQQLHLKTIKGETIRLGDLAIRSNFCSTEQFQTLIDDRTQKPVTKQ